MAGKYSTYPKYKDSGVKWLGEIPATWNVSRIKFFSQLNPSKQAARELPFDTEVSFLPMEAIGEQGELDTSQSKRLGDLINGYTYVADGDVMIAKITPCFENGKGAIAEGLKSGVGFATTEVIPLRSVTIENNRFLYYLLSCPPFRLLAEGSMYGAGGQKRVNDSFVANYHFALPPDDEVRNIANFLDHETAKIDTLIEKQQQLIKLLKEKRQAVISHAVTKGLNPDAPMKDSGVEWLGEVPEHWDVCKLKHIIHSLESGVSVNAADTPAQENEKGVLKTSCVYTRSFRGEENKTVFIAEESRLKCPVRKGAIVVSRMNTPELVGASALVEDDFPNIYLPDRLWQTVFPKNFMHNPKYLAFFMMIQGFRSQISLSAEGASSSMQNIAKEDYLGINVALPEVNEQSSIVEYLEGVLSALQSLENKAERATALLQERRTALISAAVTGKIDVRNWKPEPSAQPMEATA